MSQYTDREAPGTGARRPWDGVIPDDEQAIYRLAGFGRTAGFGRRPALLVIDVQYRSMGREPLPLHQAIEEYPTSCGEAGWTALPQIITLTEQFRRLGLPIIYPYVAPKASYDAGQFGAKVPGVMTIPQQGYSFVEQVHPRDEDILIPKFHASSFSGTPLASYLVGLRVDSLIVTGCTTSGCVRSTVVDACSFNYKTIVPEDAVYDRSRHSHAVNLFDMASKYADVMTTAQVVELVGKSVAKGENR